MLFLKIFRKLFSTREGVKHKAKELSAERKRELEEEWRKFDESQPEERQHGIDIFGDPIIAKKQRWPGSRFASYYEAPVKVLGPEERYELLCIINTHRTSKGEYIA